MPHFSRWALEPPNISLPSFIFGASGTDRQESNDKVLVDAKRPTTHNFTLSSYRDWSKLFAVGLLQAGLVKGDRIMLFSGNSIFTPIVVMGTIMARGIYNSANPGFTVREVGYQMKDCAPKFILAAPNCLEKAREAARLVGIDTNAIFLFEDIEVMGRQPLLIPRKEAHWTRLLADPEVGSTFAWEELDTPERSDQVALLAYSSGTTGLPKGVEISHYQVVSNIMQLERTVCSASWVKQRRSLGVLPCYHGLGLLYYCLMAPKLGIEVFLMDHFDLLAMLSHIATFKITELLLVPPIVVATAKHPAARNGNYNLSSMEKVVAGAAPLGKEVTEQFEELWHGRVKVRQAWGMTEAPAISIAWDEGDKSDAISTSVGELLPGVEAKLLKDDGVEETRFGERGELCLKGPNIMKRYWRNPKATLDTKTTDGWLKTGDIAYVDEQGKWYIVDRKKELIKVRGAQVPPAELEALLLEHPQIVDAAVVGVKTIAGDEEPRAYIVARNRSMVSEAEVIDYVQQRVAKQKRLCGGVAFVDAVPKTAAGKILRRELREVAAKERLFDGQSQAKL